MKYFVTGATGYVGQMLVPLFEKEGHSVVVGGRNLQKLKRLYPSNDSATYENLKNAIKDTDVVVHLAVLNNDKNYSDFEFDRVNVEFTMEVAEQAKKASVREFVFISSIHAIQVENDSKYANSKREAVNRLEKTEGIRLSVIYLPMVYGPKWPQQFNILNGFNHKLAEILFRPIAALKPTVNVAKIADHLNSAKKDGQVSCGSEVILTDNIEQNFYYRAFRKTIDLAVSLVLILGLGLIVLLIWIIIKLDSPGPGLFAQIRVGRNGSLFTCYKLRTMKLGTLQIGTHELSAGHITRLGGFLRKFKIDEIPQVINILRGEMTLVGPRPCLPVQTHLISERKKLGVLDVLPGITGLSQVQNIDMSNPEILAQSDAKYLNLRSILLDFKIIIATIRGRGFGDKVTSQKDIANP
jgi:lipopolysaccharide/colanic/teichoic acid biosynthesis glycosyltransferase